MFYTPPQPNHPQVVQAQVLPNRNNYYAGIWPQVLGGVAQGLAGTGMEMLRESIFPNPQRLQIEEAVATSKDARRQAYEADLRREEANLRQGVQGSSPDRLAAKKQRYLQEFGETPDLDALITPDVRDQLVSQDLHVMDRQRIPEGAPMPPLRDGPQHPTVQTQQTQIPDSQELPPQEPPVSPDGVVTQWVPPRTDISQVGTAVPFPATPEEAGQLIASSMVLRPGDDVRPLQPLERPSGYLANYEQQTVDMARHNQLLSQIATYDAIAAGNLGQLPENYRDAAAATFSSLVEHASGIQDKLRGDSEVTTLTANPKIMATTIEYLRGTMDASMDPKARELSVKAMSDMVDSLRASGYQPRSISTLLADTMKLMQAVGPTLSNIAQAHATTEGISQTNRQLDLQQKDLEVREMVARTGMNLTNAQADQIRQSMKIAGADFEQLRPIQNAIAQAQLEQLRQNLAAGPHEKMAALVESYARAEYTKTQTAARQMESALTAAGLDSPSQAVVVQGLAQSTALFAAKGQIEAKKQTNISQIAVLEKTNPSVANALKEENKKLDEQLAAVQNGITWFLERAKERDPQTFQKIYQEYQSGNLPPGAAPALQQIDPTTGNVNPNASVIPGTKTTRMPGLSKWLGQVKAQYPGLSVAQIRAISPELLAPYPDAVIQDHWQEVLGQ